MGSSGWDLRAGLGCCTTKDYLHIFSQCFEFNYKKKLSANNLRKSSLEIWGYFQVKLDCHTHTFLTCVYSTLEIRLTSPCLIINSLAVLSRSKCVTTKTKILLKAAFHPRTWNRRCLKIQAMFCRFNVSYVYIVLSLPENTLSKIYLFVGHKEP